MRITRRAARAPFNLLLALALVVSLGPASGPGSVSRAWADDPAPAPKPTTSVANYFGDLNTYKQFGIDMDTTVAPADFNDDATSHPFADYQGPNPQSALQFELKSKAYGWSAPQPLAVLPSAPYWADVESAGTYAPGTTTFKINGVDGDAANTSWKVGGGFNVSADLLLGAGLTGKDVNVKGIDFAGMLNQAGAFYQQNDMPQPLEYEEYADSDRMVIASTPVVVYEYEVFVPEFTITQAYLDEYNSHAAPDQEMDPSAVGTTIGGEKVPCKVVNTYSPALGVTTMAQYNNTAATLGDPSIESLDMDSVFKHTTGEPLSYYSDITKLPSVYENSNGKALVTGTQAAVGTVDPVPATATVDSTAAFENGFRLSVASGLSLEVSSPARVGFSVQPSQGGWESASVNGADWMPSNAQGAAFATGLPQLPANCDAYEHTAQMAVWQNATVKGNPLVAGYVVTVPNPDAVPKSLPALAVPYSTKGDAIAWAWSSEIPGSTNTYNILTPSGETWNVAGTVNDSAAAFVTPGASDGKQQVRFQALNPANPGAPSALGPVLTGYTNSGAPTITTQPKHVNIKENETATFTVEAESKTKGTLTYQWYVQNTKDKDKANYATWEPLNGETKDTLVISNAQDSTHDELRYRVEVCDTSAGPHAIATSDPATLNVDSANENPDGGKTIPNVTFEVTGKPGSSVVQHGDEVFCNYEDTLDIDIKVIDPNDPKGNGCTGVMQTIAMYVYDPSPGMGRLRQTNGSYSDPQVENGAMKTTLSVKPSDDSLWQITGLEGKPKVFQMMATFVPKGHQDNKSKYLPTTATLFINYGTTDLSRKAHLLNYDMDGDLLPDRTEAVTPLMELPDITPQRVGYQFEGWYLDEAFNSPLALANLATLPYTDTVPVYGKWTPIDYPITYNLNGGSNNSANPSTLHHNSGAVELLPATKAGATFKGWFLDTDLTQPISCIPQGLTSGLTLTAAFEGGEPLVHTVTIDVDGTTTTQLVNDGECATKPTDPTKAGSRFMGWYATGSTEPFDWNAPITHDVTVVAKFAQEHSVTFLCDGNHYGPVQKVLDGEKATRPAADPAKTGWTFKHWALPDGTAYDFDAAVTDDLTLTAVFERIVHTVAIDIDGTITTQKVNHGEKAIEPAPPTKDGFTFKGWATPDGTAFTFDSPITADVTVKALFEAVPPVTPQPEKPVKPLPPSPAAPAHPQPLAPPTGDPLAAVLAALTFVALGATAFGAVALRKGRKRR